MKNLFNKLSLSSKLAISAIIPLLALAYYFYIIQSDRQVRIKTTENFISRLNNTIAANNLVHELQRERRYSIAYLLKKGSENELLAQRKQVSIAFTALEESLQRGFNEEFQKFAFGEELDSWRDKVIINELPGIDILENYQLVIDRLQGSTNIKTDNPAIIAAANGKLEASSAIARMTNLISVMRLEIYLALIDSSSDTKLLDDFDKNYRLFKSFEQELLSNKNKDIINTYNQLQKEKGLESTLAFFDKVFQNSGLDKELGADDWWRISVDGMDELQTLHQNLLKDVQNDSIEAYAENVRAQRNLLIFLIGLSLLMLLIVFFAIQSTTEQINILKNNAEKIALGETGINLPPYPKDALGNLAKSFIQIDRNNRKIAQAALEIGQNKFDTPFIVRSEKDELGIAILKMRKALKEFSVEKESEIWIQTGLSTINSVLIGKRKLDETCKTLLAAMVNYLNGDVGTLYLHNYANTLELECSHAALKKELIPKIILLGQSRLGAAAEKMEPEIFDHIPDNYLTIGSSLGQAQPCHLLLIPLVRNGQIEGIMEIASFVEFHPATKDFVKQVAVNIANSLQNMKSRLRLQELLEETQTQTEELQTQHSELENLNSELEAQTQKLQASEEELKVQQEELMQVNQELEERSSLLEDRNQIIIERNLDIQKKAEELELSTRYKSEFLANMSHELRTPLNSILLLSRLLSENGTNNLSKEEIEYAEVIQSSGKGLLSLIDEILDLSKIESGKMTVEIKLEPVEEIIAAMRSLFGEMAKQKNLDLQFSVDSNVPHQINTDRLRLEQILKNLMSNALKFTSKGYIHLNIEPAAERPGFISIIVKDSGIGIAPEKQEHIFGAFQQADGSTRRKYGGTGLGLAISRELAKLLGGELLLTSKVNYGSEFTLVIPIDVTQIPDSSENEEQETEIEEPIETVSEKPKDGAVKTFIASIIPADIPDDRDSINKGDNIILIIEDDPSFAKSLLTFTRKKGYKGLVAVRGDHGIGMAIQYSPKAILLDLQLPVKDGWQVMDELKSDPRTRHIPIHMMSSYEIKKESLRKGAIDFINKPVAFEQMNEIFIKLEKALTRGPKKVLIIEENTKHAQALSYYLDSFNVKAEIKDSITDGVSALQNSDIDCVILDMGIPDETGYNTLELVKDNPGLENLPIIVFTGKNLSRSEEQKIKQYADSIVVKTAHSYQRILDEVTLFLHLIEETKIVDGKTKPLSTTGRFNEILEGKTVLIADDDIRNIFSLTKALEHHNMKVLSANDGKEALEILEAHQDEVDIILMDMMMPEMDGYESIAKIRKELKLTSIPILAVTAKAMIGDREKCIKAGASDYISKPVDLDQLVSLLRVWLYN